MIRIGHLLDRTVQWDHRVGVGQLIDRLPRDGFRSTPATIDPDVGRTFRALAQPVEVLPSLPGLIVLSGPSVARFVARRQIDLIHAWGMRSAVAARAVPQTPLVIHLFDPSEAACHVRLLRVMARREGFAVVCSTETVRRRLIEGGLAPEFSVTIRPGIDFALINRSQRGPLRDELGLTRDDFAVILPAPVTRTAGQFEASQAVAHLHQWTPNIRVIVPGGSPETRRIIRSLATFPRADVRVVSDPGVPFEELLTVSNALLVTPRGDISTTAIAWAMAAGVVVIGTAVHSVAELIANKLNGMLFKHVRGRSMFSPIASLLREHQWHRKVTETARGHAYEVFGLRRCIDQHVQVYGNVLAGKPPGEGIVDPAVVG